LFSAKADEADIQSDVTTVRVGRQLRLFDTASLDPLGSVDLPPPPNDHDDWTSYWSTRAPSVFVFGNNAVWEVGPPNPWNPFPVGLRSLGPPASPT
jgi:hypothetical protein